MSPALSAGQFKAARESFERRFLANLLDEVDWNISRASRAAGISRKYLYVLIRKYGLGRGKL